MERYREAGQRGEIRAVGHVKEKGAYGIDQSACQQGAAQAGQFTVGGAMASPPIKPKVGAQAEADHRRV
jgi:hypothetical protein